MLIGRHPSRPPAAAVALLTSESRLCGSCCPQFPAASHLALSSLRPTWPPAAVFIITSLETVGDVTATEEASFLPTTGPSHERRIRGALLNDGINSIFSSLVGCS